jgi:hypothetical protein
MSQPPNWGDMPATWGQMETGAQPLKRGTTTYLETEVRNLIDAAFVKWGNGLDLTWTLLMQALPQPVLDPETGRPVLDDQSRPLQQWNPMCLIYVQTPSVTINEIHWRCSNPQLIWDWSEKKAEMAAQELVGILQQDKERAAAAVQQGAAQSQNGAPSGLIIPGR